MLPVTNISTYKFATLDRLKPLRQDLALKCKNLKLKGTILLSTEGINLFVAGERLAIDSLVDTLRNIPGLGDLTPKTSESDHQPFTRMLVKIKKEIIAFGIESVRPQVHTSPKLRPQELKRWLDEGKDLVLLDARNDYEVKLGTFKHAVPIGVDQFRDFPKAVRSLPPHLKDRTIVMFCTGGIRCEKAGPFMEQEGFQDVYQLDGGILKYFEDCGDAHYSGSCFVFDQRVGVDPCLLETNDKQCFICLSPLTVQDQKDPRYRAGKTCPFCFKTPEEKMTESISARHLQIQKITSPLPGSAPYLNIRPLKIPQKYDGFKLIDFVSAIFPQTPFEAWASEFKADRFLDNSKAIVPPNHVVRVGERYLHTSPHTSEPNVATSIKIFYEDAAIIVIEKPAPLPVHPCGRFNRNTLTWILNELYHPHIPRPAHRLDANTTGIIVFARSRHFAGLLQPQFENGQVEKKYLAQIQGHPEQDLFSCDTPISSQTTELGARDVDFSGEAALTHFKVLKRYADGTSLIEASPKTGRTNQIRAHLWSLGFPVVNDPTYLPDGRWGSKQTSDIGDPRMRLHSHSLTFTHPLTREKVTYSSPVAWKL